MTKRRTVPTMKKRKPTTVKHRFLLTVTAPIDLSSRRVATLVRRLLAVGQEEADDALRDPDYSDPDAEPAASLCCKLTQPRGPTVHVQQALQALADVYTTVVRRRPRKEQPRN